MSGTVGQDPPERRPDGPTGAPTDGPTGPEANGWIAPDQVGWGELAGEAGPPPGVGSPRPASTTGWTAPASDWQVPDVKPGVIPLRPLGVGEILDGAVTTIRRNLPAMLGPSAVVAALTRLLASVTMLWIFGDRVVETGLGLTASMDQVAVAQQLDDLAVAAPAALVSAFVTLLATVFLTGMLTVVVGQAVLGRKVTVTQAWQLSRSRLLRLLGLTIVYTLLWLSPFILVLALSIGAAIVSEALGLTMITLGLVPAAGLAVWLYVRYAMSLPSIMLETYTDPLGATRPVGIVGSLRRSAALVRRSWWRVFAILLLITFIGWLIGQVLAVPFGLPTLLGGIGDSTAAWLILTTVAGMVAATITAPFSAAATALLYIDLRMRREGLDVELSRAAGAAAPRSPGDGVPPPSGRA